MPVTQLIGVAFTVADLDATAAFYRERLGFETGPEQRPLDPAWIGLLGLKPGTAARLVDVVIGRQVLKLVVFDPPGKPYPPERASNDQWFQHVALVTADIDAAWKRLEGGAPGKITEGAPVLLPPNTGSVTAFKFRDPEGHPLELISFPQGISAPVWHETSGTGILGYDHTAISVFDLERSLTFYTGLLGFHVGGRSLNRGPEQDRLDGLPHCEVDVVALAPASSPTPHVELLHYRTPPGRAAASQVRADDVASARQIHRVDGLDALVGRLEAHDVAFASPGIVPLQDGGRATAIRDPDGHMIVLME